MVESDKELKAALKRDMSAIAKMSGPFAWANDAMLYMSEWYMQASDSTAPKHSRLQSYNPRRHMHVIKIAMAKSASESSKMILELSHIKWAIKTLMEAEAAMPQIFQEMSASPDATIIEDLNSFMVLEAARNNTHVVDKHKVVHWLSGKVPTKIS